MAAPRLHLTEINCGICVAGRVEGRRWGGGGGRGSAVLVAVLGVSLFTATWVFVLRVG